MKTRYITVILILFAFVINSCDKVSAPYVESRDYCSGNKKVLLEDYTGHGCVNCPGAAVLARELKEKFCDRVVIIGVHAGYFAQPNFENNPIFATDLTTEAGNIWDLFFGNSVQGNPNGLVDRVEGSSGYVHFPATWGAIIDPLLEQPALALITMSNDFDTENKVLSTTIKTDFQVDLVGNYKVIVCITQDNIISPQKNNDEEIGPTPIDMNYVHNHVLRKVINGSWGEDLSAGSTVNSNTTYEKTYTQEFIDEWIPKDCHIVAFVYNAETKLVIQVEELSVLD
ncbi:MAG: Omp28 family outer membrane lipoprotein [Proteobacteria bacterium]|nr:Omp28 family outer membrane lipoprotein [Pseudomonadota bacterium]